MPLAYVSEASLTSDLISSYVVAVSRVSVRSIIETSTTGTRTAMPVSFPFMGG